MSTRQRAVVVCIGLLVLVCVVPAESVEKNTGLQFKDWGISFTTPVQWHRWPGLQESAFAVQAQQSGDAATLKEQVVHLAGWSTADEGSAMILTVKRERSGDALRLSDLVARYERDDKRAKDYGDAIQINRLEIGKVGGRKCVIHDVILRGGVQMLTYEFVSGSEQVALQWMFRDAARFAQLKPAVDGVLQSLSLGGNTKKQ